MIKLYKNLEDSIQKDTEPKIFFPLLQYAVNYLQC